MKAVLLTMLTMLISFNSVFSQNKKDSLIVFVGEMIELTKAPREKAVDTILMGNDTSYTVHISMDSRFTAKYKILQLIHGTYKRDAIEFTVFDHYGQPAFSKYKTVMLFVSIGSDGKLYHEKYQYFNLYRTKNGKWASPYPARDYDHPYKDKITVKPEKITFAEKVSFPVDNFKKEQIEIWYPAPYYEINNGSAIPVYGNYLDDLFKLKQQTVLKARGIF